MNSDTAASLTIMVLAAAVLFVLMLLITTAAPAGICLSKSEARHLWPRQHIYWYSRDRCWSNRRGPPRGLKLRRERLDPVFGKTVTEMLSAPTYDVLPPPRPQLIAPPDPPDECCWPPLEDDFETRWNVMPLQWLAKLKE
jgi:hypothetical protein